MISVRAWRLAVVLVVLAACGGADRRATPGTVAGSGSGHGSEQEPAVPAASAVTAVSAPVPPLPGAGARAYVADTRGLVEVAVPGGSQVVSSAAGWCSTDARAQVVWFTTSAGLHAFDLVDRRTRTIIRGDLGELAVIVLWGPERLGGESGLLFDVGVGIEMMVNPELEAVMGCEGDRSWYCFEQDLETPLPRVAALQQRVGTLRLADPPYMAELAKRGRPGALWLPAPLAPTPPRRQPVVDQGQCEDPTSCGSLIAIPGSPLWLVHTGNSRGDYYHETRELWDPATGAYLRVSGAAITRSAGVPSSEAGTTDYRGMRVSRTGLFTFEGAVFDAAKVYYAPRGAAAFMPSSCGWADGGWRIRGPTDLWAPP